MALSPTVTSMCNQLIQKYDSIINPVKAAKSNIKSRIRSLISSLNDAVYNPIGDLQAELNSIQVQVNNIIPGDTLIDINEIESFLKNCPLFGANYNTVAAVNGTTPGIFDKINGWLNTSIYDEFIIADAADAINKLLDGTGYIGGSNISPSLKQADLLIQCLNTICGTGYNPYVVAYEQDVNSLYDEMHINSDPLSSNYGLLDYDYVYSQTTMTPTQISNMNYVIGGVTNLKSGAKTAVDSSINAIKNAIGGGLI